MKTAMERLRRITITYDAGIPKAYDSDRFPNLRYGVGPRGELHIFRFTAIVPSAQFGPLRPPSQPDQSDYREEIACFAPGKWVSYDLEYEQEDLTPADTPWVAQEPEPVEMQPAPSMEDGMTVELPKVTEGGVAYETDLSRAPVNVCTPQEAMAILKERLERQEEETVILDPDSTGDPALDHLIGAPRPSGVLLTLPGATSYRVTVPPPVQDFQRPKAIVPITTAPTAGGGVDPFRLASSRRNFREGIDAGRRSGGGVRSLRSPLL